MKPVVLVDENIPWVEHYLGPVATLRKAAGRAMNPGQLQDVDALLVRSVTRVDQALLHNSQVSFVGTATSGIDHIDRDYLQQQGIGFSYAPGSNANSVVEYVLAAIAAVDDQLERLLHTGRVGIVGYGVIGKRMAARLKALGISYSVYDPWLDAADIDCSAELEAVLACDVVTLHAELTHEQPWPSFHLLGERELCCLRPDALLINASRGPVVDNAALLSLQQRGDLTTRLVLDVWEGEPSINGDLLQKVFLGSPHIAGYSLDGKILATTMLCRSLQQHFDLAASVVPAPVDDPHHIVLPAGLAGANMLRYLLRQRYDIFLDDRMLRESTLGKVATDAAASFDLLRKNYRQRRELIGARVRGEPRTAADVALIAGLGCVPELSGAGQ